MKNALMVCCVSALLACPVANASDIIGYDMRGDNYVFNTTTDNFVANYMEIATPSTWDCFAMDLSPDATTLYGIQFAPTNGTYGIIDPTTGTFTPMGTLSGPSLADNFSGLTVDPTTGTWYLMALGADGVLWAGDIETGVFTMVGGTGYPFMIDIAIDGEGNCYGHDISTDSLYSIDLSTGAATLVGATGHAANYAQGMDFDYSTNILYATIYTGGGTGAFCQFDLTTGQAVVLEDTTPLNMEAEMVVDVAHSAVEPTKYVDGPDYDPFTPVTDPTTFPWHELRPVFCTWWDCIDWFDNSNGELDTCDYMLLTDGVDTSWWHVEEVSITVVLELVEGGPPEDYLYFDFIGDLSTFPLGLWRQIYPAFNINYDCIDYIDNGNGIVDNCDWFICDTPGGQLFLHVVGLGTDLFLIEEDPPTNCPEDVNGDGVVNVLDLLLVLAAWGPCP